MRYLQQASPRAVLAGTFLVFLGPFMLVELFPSQLDRVMDKSLYLVFHNIAEFFSIMVSLSVFSVGWFTYEQSKDRHALFLGAAFLVVGLLDFMHTMSNAAMPAFFTPNSTNKSTQFWIAARLFDASAFLISAFIYPGSNNRWLAKQSLLPAALILLGLLFTGVVFFPAYLPATAVPGIGLTPLKRYLEYLVIGLLAGAAVAYWRRMNLTGERSLVFYPAAFIICMFSEGVFASYTTGFDTYNVLGHVYKIAAFLLIFQGIFVSSVKRPYLDLLEAHEELQREAISRKELAKEVEERRQVEATLRVSESKYRSLFSHMIDGFALHQIEVDEAGKPVDYVFLEVNAVFEELTGLKGVDIVNKRVSQVLPGIEKDPADWIGTYGRVALTGDKARFEQYSTTLRKWFSVTAYSPLPYQFATVFEDITERKQAANALEAAIGELTRSNKELEQFAYICAHDLQEPLRQVQSFVQLLQDRYADRFDGKATRYFQFVSEGATRMSGLVRGLLEYSRIGGRNLPHRTTPCQQALDAALADLRVSIAEARACITQDDLPVVTAEPMQLAQLFQNLIGNAIKFRRDDREPRIHVGCRSEDGYWSFAVKDNGIGIAPGYEDKIFLIFQRLHGREHYPGMGIGLAICKKIVEQHGGRIWADSHYGEGSTLNFTLPKRNNGE